MEGGPLEQEFGEEEEVGHWGGGADAARRNLMRAGWRACLLKSPGEDFTTEFTDDTDDTGSRARIDTGPRGMMRRGPG